MKKIGIIGSGFCGTITASQLVRNAKFPIEIVICGDKNNFAKGIAYTPYSKQLLLNVPAAKMSAFPASPEHFLEWVMQQENYTTKDPSIVGASFLPRFLYGNYLASQWKETQQLAHEKKIVITTVESFATDLDIASNNSIRLSFSNGGDETVDYCIIATGNELPGDPKIINTGFFSSKNYFRNPWNVASVTAADPLKPVLIIGNGLTMVDTVLGLLDHGFRNEIFSISTNGFNILPHRHGGIKYSRFIEELDINASLHEIVRLFNRHVRLIREFGMSAEPVIDSLRPYTQKIWQRLSVAEKKLFMARLRHLWGVARHRIPTHIHDKIQQLRIANRLHIYSGKIIDITENGDDVTVLFYSKKHKKNELLHVSRVINCTGPETDLERLEKSFLNNCLRKGLVAQDELKLGINASTETFGICDAQGNYSKNIFTLGSNLKGMLWESTAVPELREQAERLAKNILEQMSV